MNRFRALPFRYQLTIRFVGVLVTFLSLANLVRMGRAWYYAVHLPDLPLTAPWWYLIAMGGFWGIVLFVVAGGLAELRRWGRDGTLAAVTLYEAHVWLNHRLFDANDYAHQTWPRDALLSLLLLALVWGILLHPRIREVYERREAK